MKRLLAVIVVLLFLGGGVLALFWFGNYFSSYAFSRHSLSVEKPKLQRLSLGAQAVFDLRGTGFSQETSVSLFMDVHNLDAVLGSFPLEGVYNESLLYGDFLYLASDEGGFQVLDIKNPQQPQLLKKYLVGRTIIDIHRNGNYLYLSCAKLGVSIMLIQGDGILNHIADVAFESIVKKCRSFGDFLYVAAGSEGVLIYDVRQPEKIELVQTINFGSFISNMTVAGDYLYTAAPEGPIEIYHLADPQRPLLTGSLELSETLNDFVVHQGQLYVATESGVSTYSLLNGRQPKLLKRWSGFGSAEKIFAGLEHIYISDSFSGLRIIDSEADASPDFIDLNIDPRTIIETPDYLLVAGSNKGLLIVDRNALSSRQVIKTINTTGSARDLFIKNQWLYVADSRGGVLLQNLASEGNASTISARKGVSFAVHQNLLFVAEGKQGIEVFDISDPGQPEVVADWPTLESLRLDIAGDYLLLAKGISGVELIDISDFQHPLLRDVLLDVHALDLVSDGHLIFIASMDEGLLIYEITEDSKFKRLSQVLTPFPMNQFDLAMAVQVQDGIAYIANGHSGLLIVDVKKPQKPIILSSIGVPGMSKRVRVVDEKAFISSHHGGINIVNVEDPQNPVLLNSISIPGLSRGLQVVDDLIYLAHNAVGVTVISIPTAAKKVDLISERQMSVVLPSPRFPGRYSLQISNKRDFVVYDGVVQYR